MIHEYSPIEIGLDALGIEPGQNPLAVFELEGKDQACQEQVVSERIEQAMISYPEIKIEILAAGMSILLKVSTSIGHFRDVVLPRLDRSVDFVAS